MAEQAAQKALAIVKKLAKKEGQPIGERHLPQRELQQCSGLCFTFVKKAGVGVTVETGSGFVIAKRGGSWSAPLFISVYAGGIGLSLGYSEIDSLIVLDTPEAVKRYAANQTDVATDIAAVGPLGKVAGQDSVSLLTLSDETFPYSVSHGTLVDLSYKGMRYRVDAATNRELYGAETTPEQILGSESTAPEAFKPLFDVLSKYLETGVMEA